MSFEKQAQKQIFWYSEESFSWILLLHIMTWLESNDYGQKTLDFFKKKKVNLGFDPEFKD